MLSHRQFNPPLVILTNPHKSSHCLFNIFTMAPSAPPTEEYLPQETKPLRDIVASDPEPFYNNYQYDVPIAMDIGSSSVRVGLTNTTKVNNIFPSTVSRYRDRKTNYMLTLVGNDCYSEAANRSNIRTPFDGPLVTNWDYMETIMDYSLEHLSVTSDNGGVNNPIIMTEPVMCPLSQRKSMYELLFEVYLAPKVTFGIDSLFSYYANNDGKMDPGMVINAGHDLTHVIPVVDGKGILLETKRIDWGGDQCQSYLGRLLALKYPYFPTRLSPDHMSNMVQDYCYILNDYDHDLAHYLDMNHLENHDVVIQAPVPADLANPVAKKTDEELAQQAERRREQGRRLQEQARQKRQEKLIQKQQELTYYNDLKAELSELSPEDVQIRLEAEEFDGLSDFNKYVGNLEKSVNKPQEGDDDNDDEDDGINPATSWPLIEIPDDHLNPEQLKEKRKQKLLKGNYEARQKAKELKRQEEEEQQQYLQQQQEWRNQDLEGWCSSKRIELANLTTKLKDNQKLLESFKDRKSAAAQQRMKNIADLANEETGGGARRKRKAATATIDNDPNDTFGANDDDWNLYRDINNVTIEEQNEELKQSIEKLELELLEFDPNFHHEDTLAAAETFDWKNLALHKFLHGPRPNISLAMAVEGMDQDQIANHPEIITKNHQIHLNVERIRVPEILFKPYMAGLDQAGITEVLDSLLHKRLDGNFTPGGQSYLVAQNILLTGGLSQIPNFKSRIVNDFTSFLPVGTPLRVNTATNPITDPWRGMQMWAQSQDDSSYVTRAEYEEYGPEYIKEHGLGNVCLR